MKKSSLYLSIMGLASLLFSCSGGGNSSSSEISISSQEKESSEQSSLVTSEIESSVESESETPVVTSEEKPVETSEVVESSEELPVETSEAPVEESSEEIVSSAEPIVSSEESSEGPKEKGYELDDVAINSQAGYEIFVESFADSDGNHIGDLKGIEQRLDYISKLGVNYIWLTPIHESPSYHHYDVLDYYSVSSRVGTLDDFADLCEEAEKYNIKIVMDMVFNHASNKSEWFQKALNDYAYDNTAEDSCKDDFVFLTDISEEPASKKFQVVNMNNKKFYYECNFDTAMPEFNLDSEKVREEQKNIMKYWLDLGAGGFRFDGAAYYYYGKKSQNIDYLRTLKAEALEMKEDLYLIGEAWESSMTQSAVAQYYSRDGMPVFDFPFSIDGDNYIIRNLPLANGETIRDEVLYLMKVMRRFTPDGLPALFLSNHDMDRLNGSFTLFDKSIRDYIKRLAASLYILAPGTPWIYYGEEVEMTGSRGSASTDANRRLHFPWTADGSSSYDCKDPSGTTYSGARPTRGGFEVMADNTSIYTHYAKLLNTRSKFPQIANGTYAVIPGLSHTNLCAYKITYNDEVTYLIHNLKEKEISIDLEAEEILDEIPTFGLAASLSNKKLTIPAFSSVLVK